MTELHPKLTTPGFGVSDKLIKQRQAIADRYLPTAREIFAREQLITAEQLERLKLTGPQKLAIHGIAKHKFKASGPIRMNLLKLGLITTEGKLTMLGHKAVLR